MKGLYKYIHPVDLNSTNLSEAFKALNPTVYRDDHTYSCLSGGNPVDGIFGYGNTPEEAIEDWERAYAKRKENKRI